MSCKPRDSWLVSLALVVVGAVYSSSFWGLAAAQLPEPWNRWSYFYRPYVEPWWCAHVLVGRPAASQRMLLVLTASVVLGLIVPGVVLRLAGWRLRDVGLGPPSRLGRRLMLAGAALSVPFAIWLGRSMRGTPEPVQYVSALLAMIPEHFLICGVYVAVLLPGRRLPDPVPLAPVEGSAAVYLLRWLGLAQLPLAPGHHRGLAWFGLSASQLTALLVSGALFAAVHFGKPRLELALSMPGGLAVAYLTLRSHSIWPAIVAHYALNAVALITCWASR